jgi:hypothetical protein
MIGYEGSAFKSTMVRCGSRCAIAGAGVRGAANEQDVASGTWPAHRVGE